MVALRVLMLVEDTPPVIHAAAAMAAAGPARPLLPPPTSMAAMAVGVPPQMQLDQSFAPVPVNPSSAVQALAAAGMRATMAARPQTLGLAPMSCAARSTPLTSTP
jgi:hypothetical protein